MAVERSRNPFLSGLLRSQIPPVNRDRLSSGLSALDAIIGGGLLRGGISEITGPVGTGRTTIVTRIISAATRAGELVAWIESCGCFDPTTAAEDGAVLDRILWVSLKGRNRDSPGESPRYCHAVLFKAVELVLKAGGFGVVVVDVGSGAAPLPHSVALRLKREAEQSGSAIIVIAPHGICGAFAALTLRLARLEMAFSRFSAASPALFDGLVIRASVARNKAGPAGGSALIRALVDPRQPGPACRERRVSLPTVRLNAVNF